MPPNTVVIQQSADNTVVVEEEVGATVQTSSTTTTIELIADPPVDVVSVGTQGPPGASNFLTTNTFAIGGLISVASGDTDFIPPFFFQKNGNQTSVLKKVRHRINSGTSATVKLQKNAADITGYTGITVTTTPTTTTQDHTLADGDVIALVVTDVSGSPQNLTVTLVIEHTIV